MSTDPTQLQQLLALARIDFACYSVAMLPQFLRAPHVERIIAKLEAVERGDISRLMIFLPPRHGKISRQQHELSGLVSWSASRPSRDFRQLRSRVKRRFRSQRPQFVGGPTSPSDFSRIVD